MAATSTNKQPLLVDRIFHYVINLDTFRNNGIDVTGTNSAELLVDSTSLDGAIVEDIYAISRSTLQYGICLYLSTANDYLRPNEAYYIGGFASGTNDPDTGISVVTHWEGMPRTLTPVPQVGDNPYNHALYVPKGKALWGARLGDTNVTDAPLLGCQGGWY